jgi:hypothetical protein
MSNIHTLSDIKTEYNTKPLYNITNVSYVQLISRKALKTIHKIRSSLEEDTKKVIESLHTKLRGNKLRYENPINYSLCKSIPGQLGYGRYCGGRGSLETLERAVRGSLCSQYYYDIDVVNCHPVIIPQMAEKIYNMKMPYLTRYVENRSHYFNLMKEKFNCGEDETKEVIIKILYGGACASTIKVSPDWEEKMPTDFHEIKKEMVAFSKHLVNDSNHKALYNHLKASKKFNIIGSLTSWIIQTEERKILESMVHCLTNHAYFVDVLSYDGCQVRKIDDNHSTSDILELAQKTIKDETGYDIQLKVKPFTQLTLDEEPEDDNILSDEIIVDDKYACTAFINLMGEDMIKKNGTIWLYNSNTGVWETGDTGILSAVLNNSEALTFKQRDKDGNIRTFNYGGSTKNIKQMLHHLDALLPVTSSTEYTLDKSKGCILFKDGYYDMKEKTFNRGFDSSCRSKFFTKRVIRNFVEKRNPVMEAEVNKVLFENPYNNSEVGAFYKYIIARAIGGHIEDKVWTSIVGNPDCGKGAMSSELRYVFDEYVGSYNPNVLKFNLRDGTDEARKLSWYVPLIGCRIALGNEVRLDGKGIDGNQMKTLSSGGDMLQLRQNFSNQTEIEMITTFFLLVNDMPPITPCDKALKNRLRCIPHTKSFVNKPQEECNQYESESDPKLKEKLSTDDWINAFFWIIMDAYNETVNPPKEVIDECDELFVVEDVKIKTLLQERYEFVATDDKENFVSARDIIHYLQDEGVKMSDTKVGRELKKIGLVSGVKKFDKKTIRVYYGLKE